MVACSYRVVETHDESQRCPPSGEPRGLVATRGPTWEKEIKRNSRQGNLLVEIESLNNREKPNLQKGKAMNFDNDNKERNTINAFL